MGMGKGANFGCDDWYLDGWDEGRKLEKLLALKGVTDAKPTRYEYSWQIQKSIVRVR